MEQLTLQIRSINSRLAACEQQKKQLEQQIAQATPNPSFDEHHLSLQQLINEWSQYEQWKNDQVTILQALGVLDPSGNPTARLDVVKAAQVARLTQEDFDVENAEVILNKQKTNKREKFNDIRMNKNTSVDKELIKHVAVVARLNLTDKEVKQFLPQLKEVLEYFSMIDKVDC